MMRWLFVGGIIVLSGTFVFAGEARDILQLDSVKKESSKKEPVTERLFMRGTEIQGTVEKPHVVYVVPWKEKTDLKKQEISLERSFRMEILEPLDYERFQRQWGNTPRTSKGGEEK